MMRAYRSRALSFACLWGGLVVGCGDEPVDGVGMGTLPSEPYAGAGGTPEPGAGVAPQVPGGGGAIATPGVTAPPSVPPVAGATGGNIGGSNPMPVGGTGGGLGGSPPVGGGAMVPPNPPGGAGGTPVIPPPGPTSTGGTDVPPAPVTGDCTFDIQSEISGAIETVGIVTWSTDLQNVSEASIEFELASGGRTLTAPVDLSEPGYRTLLLGMKGNSEYKFRVVASGGGQMCTSPEQTIQTKPIPNSAGVSKVNIQGGEGTPGFFITTGGLAGNTPVYIFDSDGDPVWYFRDIPPQASRARMDWEGKNMWILELNVDGNGGEMGYVSMDGETSERRIQGLADAHHDFTVAPGGVITAILHGSQAGNCGSIVERAADGSIKEIADLIDLYNYEGNSFGGGGGFGGGFGGGGGGLAAPCHPNSILYHPADENGEEAYTVSDRYGNLYVKFSRSGQLHWQFGGGNPIGPHFASTWEVNHGHHVLFNDDGTVDFLLFNNGNFGQQSNALEFRLDSGSMSVQRTWAYEGKDGSATLGDIQRLPNGNTLVTYSERGTIHEVDPSGNQVREYRTPSAVGYVMYRESLYGPPPK